MFSIIYMIRIRFFGDGELIHSDAQYMNVAHLLSDCLPSSTCTVYTSVFSSPLYADSCTCNRPMIFTMTDQHWLKKKHPSSAAVIAAHQAEEKSSAASVIAVGCAGCWDWLIMGKPSRRVLLHPFSWFSCLLDSAQICRECANR